MPVIEAKIQTVEDIYRTVWTAISERRPIAAVYGEHRRLMCPHRLGRNDAGQVRVLCYQYGGGSSSGLESPGSSGNWRCIVLEKLRKVELLEAGDWQTVPNHSRPQRCVTHSDIDVEDLSEE